MGVISVASRFRANWDWLALVGVIASCVVSPYIVAFGDSTALLAIVAALDVFFACDIALSFRTTFSERGVEVTEPARIRRHYQRGMLVADALALVPMDFILLLVPGGAMAGSLLTLLRLNRLFRLVRLFAVFRGLGRRTRIRAGLLRIAKFLMVLGLLTHWVSCAWFYIPFSEGLPPSSWVVAEQLTNASSATQYLRSLYWTVTTMTSVGFGDITPNRNAEYAFSIVVMFLGASMYAFMIGNVASLLANIDASKTQFFSRVEAVTQYLHARDVPEEVNQRIHAYYEHLWERHRGLREDSLLRDLPDPVRLELLLELTKTLLAKVPLFAACPPALRNALVLALRPQLLGPGVFLVREGEMPHEVYFLASGRAEITTESESVHHGELEEGDHFGLLSLTLGERRNASVRTLTYCDVFVLDGHDFENLKAEYPELKDVLKKIASERSEKLSKLLLDGVTL